MPFKSKAQLEKEKLEAENNSLPASVIDSNETMKADDVSTDVDNDTTSTIAALADAVTAKMIQNQTDAAMGAVDEDEYKKHHKGVTVTPSTDKHAYQGPLTARQKEDLIQRLQARTATAVDMALIDESMILDLPFIKVSDFSIPGQYSPIPKNPEVRFRWVNCVNALQSNMQRFLALGFESAHRDDVDETKTPLSSSMIQGTEIKQYDVVLMKINVLKLMSLYKKNIMNSAYKLDSATNGDMGQAAAQQTFNDDISAVNQTGVINKYRASSGKEPVTFSRT